MKTNSAINLFAALGIELSYWKNGRNRHHTKKGPGRIHLNGKPKKVAK